MLGRRMVYKTNRWGANKQEMKENWENNEQCLPYFANELIGKILLGIPSERPRRFSI